MGSFELLAFVFEFLDGSTFDPEFEFDIFEVRASLPEFWKDRLEFVFAVVALGRISVDRSESGIVKVNEKTTGLELYVPFGGMKRSLTNTFREQGDATINFYTQIKTVYMNH